LTPKNTPKQPFWHQKRPFLAQKHPKMTISALLGGAPKNGLFGPFRGF